MEFLQLLSGVLIPLDAAQLAWRLEDAGHALTARDDKLLVSNGLRLSVEDRTAIQRFRLHLLAVAAECSTVEAPSPHVDDSVAHGREESRTGPVAAPHVKRPAKPKTGSLW